MKKKVIALALALCLIVGMLPLSALADGEPIEITSVKITVLKKPTVGALIDDITVKVETVPETDANCYVSWWKKDGTGLAIGGGFRLEEGKEYKMNFGIGNISTAGYVFPCGEQDVYSGTFTIEGMDGYNTNFAAVVGSEGRALSISSLIKPGPSVISSVTVTNGHAYSDPGLTNKITEAGEGSTVYIVSNKTDVTAIDANAAFGRWEVLEGDIKKLEGPYTSFTMPGHPVKIKAVWLLGEQPPSSVFTPTGYDTGTLTNVTTGMRYSVDEGTTWLDITGTSMEITGVQSGVGLLVKQLGDSVTTVDSNAQYISIGRATTPSTVRATDSVQGLNDGTITVAEEGMEYKLSTATEWTDISGTAVTGLAPGTYHVRRKGYIDTFVYMASDSVEVTINEIIPVKNATPEAEWDADWHFDYGTLKNMTPGMEYSVDGGTSWVKVNSSAIQLTNLSPGTIYIRHPGDGRTTLDSDVQAITITRKPTPTAGKTDCTTPANNDGTITGVTSEMRYKKDGGTSVPCPNGTVTGLGPGTYYVFVQGNSTELKSEEQVVVIAPYGATQEPTPKADFTATGYDTGTLSNVSAGMRLLKAPTPTTWENITNTTVELTQIGPRSIYLMTPGNGTTTTDSNAQTILITRAEPPSAEKTDCTASDRNDGTITGVTSDMEYRLSTAAEWTAITGTTVTGLAPGAYYVRVKANGSTLASANQTLTIGASTAPKETATVTLTGVPASTTYGDSAFTVTATATDCGSADGNWQITVSDDAVFSLAPLTINGNSCSVSVTPLKASADGATITAVFESDTHKGSATSANITVSKATVTAAAGTYKVSKTYDGETTAGTGSGSLSISGVLSTDTGVTVTPAIPAFSSANAGTGSLTVTLALSGTGSENYQLASASLSVPYEITKKSITPTVENIVAVDYDGAAKTPAVTVKDGSTALAATDYDVTYSNNTNAGTATATVKAKSTGNYSFSDITKDFTINKIAYSGSAITASKSVLVNKTQTGVEVDFTSAISGITGAAVASAAEGTDSDNLISNVNTDGNKVKFDVASVADAGKNATINVTISSTNYSNFTAVLTVTTVSKSEATVTLGTVPTSKTYGDSAFTLTATAANTGANGAWTWTSSDTDVLTVTDAGVVTIVGAGSATVTAAYESDATLGSATSASITVGKATVTVTAKNQSIYVNGTIPDLTNPVKDTHYTVTGLVGSDELTGTLTLTYETDDSPATPDNTTTGTYDIVVSGVDVPNTTNYNAIVLTKGTLTISNRPAPPPPSTGDDEEDETPETCNGGDSCPGHVFSDVDHTQWYHEAVDYVLKNGLMHGMGGGKFEPAGTLTRAMLCQILYNKEGRPTVTAESPFADVPAGQWYTNAVIWAAENGIVFGYGEKRFGPNDPITREQLAAILWRYDGNPPTGGDISGFKDGDKTSKYALTSMQWAVEKKIVFGKGDDILDPIGNAQRCEVAAMVMRYLEMDQ